MSFKNTGLKGYCLKIVFFQEHCFSRTLAFKSIRFKKTLMFKSIDRQEFRASTTQTAQIASEPTSESGTTKTMNDNKTQDDLTETEYLRLAVSELNQSIAYLSKMVLQLQRSINQQKPAPKKQSPIAKKDPPITIH